MARLSLPIGKKHKPEYGKQKNLFGYLQAIFMSFYSVDLYVDVRHRWRGFGAVYLVCVMAVVTLPWSISTGIEQYNYYNEVLIPTIKKMPTLDINDGALDFHDKQPFFINNPITKNPLLIIDTTGKVKDLPNKKYPDAVLLFTKYAIISQFGNMPPSVQKIKEELTGKVPSDAVITMFQRLKTIYFSAFYPMMMMLWFGVIFGFLGVIAFLLKMFSVSVMRYEISYKIALRLACVSFTPMAFLFVVFLFMDIKGRPVGFLLFLLWLGYFIFAIRSNKYAAKHPIVL